MPDALKSLKPSIHTYLRDDKMTIRTDMQRGQSAEIKRIKANLRDCVAKPNYAFSPPVTATEFTLHVAEIRREREKAVA